MLYGELYGLNSLNKLMNSYDVKSNDYQKLWSKLSCSQIVWLMNRWLWLIFGPLFVKCVSQSASTHSRQHLTLVVDGSIFRQWLGEGEVFGQYFAKYYSGQYGKAVHGFNVILCGMSLGDVFYPLHFQLRKKSQKDVDVAYEILKKVRCKLKALVEDVGLELPTLYLSVDSGFRSTALLNWCKQVNIHYIGVPKNGHIFYVNTSSVEEKKVRNKFNIKQLKEVFKEKEAKQGKKDSKNESFRWRIRAYYQCMGIEVTLLFFRLNGSKKVSVIFCNDLNIKAKTLRRRWFERTKIELLFRCIKHDLKIQQSTVQNRLGFLKKLSFALVKALYAQLLTQKVKKADKSLERIGYEKIKQLLGFHQIGREYLDKLIFDRPFS